jgi:hypothetical protein
LFFFFESYSLVLIGAPSLTRGRVCHLSVYSQSTVVSNYLQKKLFTYCVYTFDIRNIYIVLDTFTIKTIKYNMYNIQASFSPGLVKCGGCVGLTTLPPSVSRLSRQCEIINISQPYRPPRPVTGIAFFFLPLLVSTTGSYGVSFPETFLPEPYTRSCPMRAACPACLFFLDR